MLAGGAVVAIWNNITPEGREEFYNWHINEHIPERVDIPGFLRGRRYIAVTPETDPEFFTLYETADFEVLRSAGYAARLEAPTPWTRTATSHFRNTARALAHVAASSGPGSGAGLLSIRFAATEEAKAELSDLVASISRRPRICGAHLCVADGASSLVRTAESRDRTDIEAPPTWFALIEATDTDALADVVAREQLVKAGASEPIHVGFYRLEYTRD
ncbi:hypothetical protein [Bosea sp. PAMC 26642]|uniref:hypothetical protein n=1 Tax=Bosea sp. (strain PAMC 26642) TaxID=1792307 RepID=UPI0007706355|nr:hypothetical protein [Bosea sp. PAMC 26642]AMJ61553.1 hypothetical protein AXW83_15685 [Bosea sp. PAMC 26642]